MENYIGLFIGIETYQNADFLKKVSYAEDDAKGVRDAFVALGSFEDRLELLLSVKATNATIRSKLKYLCTRATRDDVVILYYAGHGLSTGLGNRITCSDTAKEDIDGSTIGLQEILGQFQACASKRIMMFLDCCHSGIQFGTNERTPTWNVSYEQLMYDARNVEHLAVFSASSKDQPSFPDLERKHGIWSYFLIDALSGNAHQTYEDRLLFNDKLQKYLHEETATRSSLITTPKRTQTPQFGGSITDRFIVADLTQLMEQRALAASTQPLPVKQSILIRWEEEPVRKLPGFNPMKHFPPTEVSARSIKWIKTLAEPILQQELEKVQREVREKLGYTRKQMPKPITVSDGSGTIDTVHFDYTIAVSQSKEHPDHYILTHTISNFRDLSTISNEDFNRLFGRILELRITLPQKLDIKAIIDAIEAMNLDSISVDYESNDPTGCTISIKGIDDKIQLTETTMTIAAYLRKSPRELIDSFSQSMAQLAAHDGPKLIG